MDRIGTEIMQIDVDIVRGRGREWNKGSTGALSRVTPEEIKQDYRTECFSIHFYPLLTHFMFTGEKACLSLNSILVHKKLRFLYLTIIQFCLSFSQIVLLCLSAFLHMWSCPTSFGVSYAGRSCNLLHSVLHFCMWTLILKLRLRALCLYLIFSAP